VSSAWCLVTGATGFVGSALVERLARTGGRVHALARATSRREHLAHLPIVWHEGDVTDRAAVRRAVFAFAEAARAAGGAAEVVHSAALISYKSADRDRSATINVDGTRHVLEAAEEAGVTRLCFVSSVVAVGSTREERGANDEDAPFVARHLRSAYVHTKRAAEELVLAAQGRLEVVVVNPGAIFGPAVVPSNSARLLESLARRNLPIPVPPGSLAVVGLDDVAAGIELALRNGRAGRRYLLTESNWRIDELLAFVLREMDGRPRLVRTPHVVFRTAARFSRLVDAVAPFEIVTPDALELLGEHYRFDSSRARRELGWAPRPFAEVLRATVAARRAGGGAR
jgi:dihydroflavonol-4-reductase